MSVEYTSAPLAPAPSGQITVSFAMVAAAESVREALPASPAVADAMVTSVSPAMTFFPASAVASAAVIASFTATEVEDVTAVLTVRVLLPSVRGSALKILARVFSMKRTP